MSVVACKIHEDKIRVAADSIIVLGYTQDKREKEAKLCLVNGMVVGGVGLLKDISLFMLYCKTRVPHDTDEFSILEFLGDFHGWKKKKTDDKEIECSFIFVYDGTAFVIEGYSIRRIKDYEAIGAGRDFALAALYLGHDADKAVDVACELSIYCEKPVNIIDYPYKKG